MNILVLSDIHGNRTALEEVFNYIVNELIDGIILLGDLIDYGPHSNEIVDMISNVQIPVLCNIWGNHEHAIVEEDYSRFSTERGKNCAIYTHGILIDTTWYYLKNKMVADGKIEFEVDGKKCLAVHGSLQDPYWKSIKPGEQPEEYSRYDYVFSGHSHLPHLFAQYYEAENSITRNKKRTVFINPGSVGQPRNLNQNAQFAIWDTVTGGVQMVAVSYDISAEQAAFSDVVDEFYKTRLEMGV